MRFLPAISDKAMKAIRQQIRGWKRWWNSIKGPAAIAKAINCKIAGWINYYGKFYKSALSKLFSYLNKRLVRWTMRKYKRLQSSRWKGVNWLKQVIEREPKLFTHWQAGYVSVWGQ